ncbi:MAG TPA: type II secretion system F family protein [Aeromicrobium sp.]|nr:type II secretion system F family protein [Aeromicrobium sp.]
MLIVGTALILASLSLVFVALGLARPREVPIAMRLRREQASGATVFVPQDADSLGRLRALTVPSLIAKAQRNLVLAGYKSGWSLQRVMIVKVAAATVIGLLSFTFFSAEPSGRRFALFLGVTALAFFYPDIWLGGRAQDRQKRIERQLPDLLDQIVIAIESGLSFEGALARVSEAGEGPLCDEFRRALQDMRLGMTRRAAYQGLASRTSIDDLKRFCKQIIQAEEFGVSIATVVRNLAHEMRIKRRYRAEEIAQKIPVKITFPLAVCFLPVLFVIILYPTFRSLLAAF